MGHFFFAVFFQALSQAVEQLRQLLLLHRRPSLDSARLPALCLRGPERQSAPRNTEMSDMQNIYYEISWYYYETIINYMIHDEISWNHEIIMKTISILKENYIIYNIFSYFLGEYGCNTCLQEHVTSGDSMWGWDGCRHQISYVQLHFTYFWT